MKSNDVIVVISSKRKECYSLVLAFTTNVVLYALLYSESGELRVQDLVENNQVMILETPS